MDRLLQFCMAPNGKGLALLIDTRPCGLLAGPIPPLNFRSIRQLKNGQGRMVLPLILPPPPPPCHSFTCVFGALHVSELVVATYSDRSGRALMFTDVVLTDIQAPLQDERG